MFQKILLCIDGSEPAMSATHLAADLAGRTKAQVDVVHVLDPMVAASPTNFAPEADLSGGLLLEYAQEGQQAVLQNAGKIFDQAHVSYRTHAEIGQPVHRIHEVATEQKSDLIVIGSRGLSTWPAILLGSTSEGVARHAPCPVLVVRGEPRGFSHLMIASDSSEGSVHAVRAGMEFAKAYSAEVSVLNVFQPHVVYPGVSNDSLDSEVYAAQVRDAIAHQVDPIAREAGISFRLCQEVGHPAEVLVGFAEIQNADLIVVGSRGLGGFKGLLLGSVSARVLHHAHCSILVVR